MEIAKHEKGATREKHNMKRIQYEESLLRKKFLTKKIKDECNK